MNRSDDALADDARALLAAYRVEEGLPADVRARVWARVDRSTSGVAEVVVAPSRVRWAVLGLALAATVAAVWWGRELVAPTPVERAPSAAAYDRDDTREGETARETTPAIETTTRAPALAPAVAPQPAALAPMRAPSPARPAASPARARVVEIDGLADETELVRAASSALSRKDAAHALALLDAGRRRFGAGTLGEEREALHVLALCELGKRTQARREADAFAAAHPSSILLSRVRSACAEATP